MNQRDVTETAAGVRRADVGDARAIAQVHVAASRAAYADVLPLHNLTVDGREAVWQRLLTTASADSFTLVDETCGEVLGFCDIVAPSRDADAFGFTPDGAELVHEASGLSEIRLRAPLAQLGSWCTP